MEDATFGEVLFSPGNACSQLSKVPLQTFSSTLSAFRSIFLQLVVK
jgi:hypothetical protein